MEYYVISPNVWNDKTNHWEDMFALKMASVGWSPSDNKGKQFLDIKKGDCIIVALRQDWKWTYYYMGIVKENIEKPSIGSIGKLLHPIVDLKSYDLCFDQWSANGSNQIPSPQRIKKEDNNVIIELINKIIKKHIAMEQYTQLLLNNKNLILTGAPGTGKTYLAMEIARSLGAEGDRYGFVQFHPSYDYSDFIEGLRPIKNEGSKEIGFERRDGIFMAFCRKALKAYQEAADKDNAPKYVFIIDEINRGEMSKIFGELFFSIDPGYRGEKGVISTQYSNLWTEDYDNTLEGDNRRKFYIPKNVYIIGTMNDIDRSVESMDFAMRRRFAFKEVKTDDRIEMIRENKKLSNHFDEIEPRMRNLNRCILTIQGLSSAYQIGASYYLKLENYMSEENKITKTSWDSLWENHIYGLLFEYLRGVPDQDKQITKLKRAFDMSDTYIEKDGTIKIETQDNNG